MRKRFKIQTPHRNRIGYLHQLPPQKMSSRRSTASAFIIEQDAALACGSCYYIATVSFQPVNSKNAPVSGIAKRQVAVRYPDTAIG